MIIKINSLDFYRAGFTRFRVFDSAETARGFARVRIQSWTGDRVSGSQVDVSVGFGEAFSFTADSGELNLEELKGIMTEVRIGLIQKSFKPRGVTEFDIVMSTDSDPRFYVAVIDRYVEAST